jgi:hypothetical protein
MKCTFSWCTIRRAWVMAWSGLQVVSATMTSTLRPPAWLLACSQYSLKPSSMSLPGVASGPVSGMRKPILIDPLCA